MRIEDRWHRAQRRRAKEESPGTLIKEALCISQHQSLSVLVLFDLSIAICTANHIFLLKILPSAGFQRSFLQPLWFPLSRLVGFYSLLDLYVGRAQSSILGYLLFPLYPVSVGNLFHIHSFMTQKTISNLVWSKSQCLLNIFK